MPKPIYLAVTLIAIASAFLIAEVFVRIQKIAPEVGFIQKGRFRLSSNLKIGYEPVPYLNYQGQDLNFYDYRGAANSLGFRDYEHNVVKESGVFRISMLGDSIAAGWGILDAEKTLPKLLESDLNTQGLNTEVMNFAVSGYNAQQEIEIFKDKGLVFQPDLVILAYNLTDTQKIDGGIIDTLQSEQIQSKKSILDQNQFTQKSHLLRILKYALANKPKEEHYNFSQDTVEDSLNNLANLSSQHNFQVLVVVFPRFDDLQHYSYSSEHDKINSYSSANGFYYLDLLPYLQNCSKNGTINIDIYHPSEDGHICAAQAISKYINSSTVLTPGKI